MKVYRERTCEVCISHSDILDNEKEVECRFHAPQILHGSGSGWSDQKWPIMHKTEWCGEQIGDPEITNSIDFMNRKGKYSEG